MGKLCTMSLWPKISKASSQMSVRDSRIETEACKFHLHPEASNTPMTASRTCCGLTSASLSIQRDRLADQAPHNHWDEVCLLFFPSKTSLGPQCKKVRINTLTSSSTYTTFKFGLDSVRRETRHISPANSPKGFQVCESL